MDEDPIGEVGPKSAAVFSGALGGARVLIELRRMYAARKAEADNDAAELPAQANDELTDRERADAWWREQNPDWEQWYQELLDRDTATKQQPPTATDRAESQWRNEVDRQGKPGSADRIAAAAETWKREEVLADTRGRAPQDLPEGWTDPNEYERKAREFGYSQEAHESFQQWHAAALADGKSYEAAAEQGRAALATSVSDQLRDYKLKDNAEQADRSAQDQNSQDQTSQGPADQNRSGYDPSVLPADRQMEAAEAGWLAHQAAHDAASDWQMRLTAQEWQDAADQAYQVAHERIAGEPDATRPTPSDDASDKSLEIGTAYGEHFADKHDDGWRAHMDDGQTPAPKFDDLSNSKADSDAATGSPVDGDLHATGSAGNDQHHAQPMDPREHNSQLATTLRLSELDTDYQLRSDLRSMLGPQMEASTGDTPMHLHADAAAREAYVETVNNFQPEKNPGVTAHDRGTKSAGDAWRSVWNSAPESSATSTSTSSTESSVASQTINDAAPAMPGGSADSQPDASTGGDAPQMPGGSSDSQPDAEAQQIQGHAAGSAAQTGGAKDTSWIDQAFPDKKPDTGSAAHAKPTSGPKLPPASTQIKPPTTGRGA